MNFYFIKQRISLVTLEGASLSQMCVLPKTSVQNFWEWIKISTDSSSVGIDCSQDV